MGDASELEALIKQAFPRRRLARAGKIHAIQMGLGQERGETKRLVDAFMRNPSDSTLKTQMEDAKRRMNDKKAHLREEHNLDASELEALITQAFPRRRLVRQAKSTPYRWALAKKEVKPRDWL